MAKAFGRKDSLWGGETLTCSETKDFLGVKKGDRFRVEKSVGKLTLIPDPDNLGSWKDSHSTENPVKINLNEHKPTDFARAYSMMVTIKKDEEPMQLFLVETENGSVKIAAFAVEPQPHENDHDVAGVER